MSSGTPVARSSHQSGGVDVVVDVAGDVEVAAVLEPVAHERWVRSSNHRCERPVDAAHGSERARREGPLEHGDVVGEEPLGPDVPLGVRHADPLVGTTSMSSFSGRLGGGRFGLRTPPSPPTGIDRRRSRALSPQGPWHPSVAAAQGGPQAAPPPARHAAAARGADRPTRALMTGRATIRPRRCPHPRGQDRPAPAVPSSRSHSASRPAHVDANQPSATRLSTIDTARRSRGHRSSSGS